MAQQYVGIAQGQSKVPGHTQSRVRRPTVAGQFYPADPHRLETTIADLLAQAPPHTDAPPKALIAPHAGYLYSGPVAAAAFACLRRSAPVIARVVLIGPSHFVRFQGIAAPTVDAFETPLGFVPVDRDGVAAIGDLPAIAALDAPHAPDHALEVELPFLQTLLNDFALVPLLVGDAAPEQVAEVLRRLWGGAETLIVISSDLSHYHNYDTARRLDAVTAAAIERGDWAAFGPDNAGLHSRVRSLAFGAQDRFEVQLGYQVAAFEVLGYRPRDEQVYIIFNEPGGMLGRFALHEDRTVRLHSR